MLVNFFHLWKLIIHCPGCYDNDDGDDDIDNNDKKNNGIYVTLGICGYIY